MMRLLLRISETVLLGLIGYNLAVSVFGWRSHRIAPIGARSRRFRVVVPAHDEGHVVGNLLSDLDAPVKSANAEVVVIADHCTDSTAEIARAHGVTVAERRVGKGGKGNALSWYLELNPLAMDEALVIVDADNRVPVELLARFADELDDGHDVLQAYLGVSNPDASALATASAVSYWASNRMVQLARRNLGWSADLGGTGMCVTAEALGKVGGFGSSLAEDQELGVKLFLAGYRVTWLHDVVILDEKPSDAVVVIRQRSRWASGRSQVAKKYVPALVSSRRRGSIDLAIRLVQPSRMGVALGSSGLAMLSILGAPTLGIATWLSVTVAQLAAPIAFLRREGVERRYLLKYPLITLLPILKIPARLIRQTGWYHTPHSGAESPEHTTAVNRD